MIERLLAADQAFEAGELDVAERLFGQVAEADARNAIAVVGLARLALRRGDTAEARRQVAAALAIDPDDAAARALAAGFEAAANPELTANADVPPAPQPLRRGGLLGWLRRLFGRRPTAG